MLSQSCLSGRGMQKAGRDGAQGRGGRRALHRLMAPGGPQFGVLRTRGSVPCPALSPGAQGRRSLPAPPTQKSGAKSLLPEEVVALMIHESCLVFLGAHCIFHPHTDPSRSWMIMDAIAYHLPRRWTKPSGGLGPCLLPTPPSRHSTCLLPQQEPHPNDTAN